MSFRNHNVAPALFRILLTPSVGGVGLFTTGLEQIPFTHKLKSLMKKKTNKSVQRLE